jgi:hypothetical protein
MIIVTLVMSQLLVNIWMFYAKVRAQNAAAVMHRAGSVR